MAAVAKNPKFAKKVGIPRSVGEEFLTADKGKTFKQGGAMKKVRKFAEGGIYGETGSAGASMGSAAAKKLKQGDFSDLKKAAKSAGLSVGQMASGVGAGLGSKIGKNVAAGLSGMGRKKNEDSDEDSDYKKGGKVHSDIKMDKKVVKKAVGMHDKQQHGGKKTNLATLKKGGMACAPKKMAAGGLAAGHKSANGIAKKGLTKGKEIKMNKGGKAC